MDVPVKISVQEVTRPYQFYFQVCVYTNQKIGHQWIQMWEQIILGYVQRRQRLHLHRYGGTNGQL